MKRDKLIDLVKCIGIISIVIGHATWNVLGINSKIVGFVYMYHLMIFVFISGYLFPINKIKNKEEMYKYIGKHIYKMLILYIVYNLIFVIMHNVLIKSCIITSSMYSKRDIVEKALAGFSFRTNEALIGPFWFIPMLLNTQILFVISINLLNKFKNNKYLYLINPIIFSVVGIALCYNNINLLYKLQISILSVPFMYMGMIVKKYWNKIEKYIYEFGWIISAALLIIVIEMNIGTIELYRNEIINPIIFYPISIVGIYFCFSLAKFLNKLDFAKAYLCYIGENSFHIMALHFFFMKIIDMLYNKTSIITKMILYIEIPYDYLNQLWPIFILLSTCLPVAIIYIIKKLINSLKKNIYRNKLEKFF